MGEPCRGDDAGPITEVWKDMPVVDASGAEVGRIELVMMGDPDAVTAQGQAGPRSGGILGDLVRLFGSESDASRQLAEDLARVGFVKVDGKGLVDRDVYVASDQIASVTDGCVHLSVGVDDLAAEH